MCWSPANKCEFDWLQGIMFKVPNVDRHPLDLHRLFKVCVCVYMRVRTCIRVREGEGEGEGEFMYVA